LIQYPVIDIVGKVKDDCGLRGAKIEGSKQKREVGLRPLRAVGSIYEPEAIGVYAYASVGMRKQESGDRKQSA
jgi:hypothetical protein